MPSTQRILLASLAICGCSVAFAQSSVSVYGSINTTVEQQKDGHQKTMGMHNNLSHLGFRGIEELGGGLKAGFVLEGYFNADDGSGPFQLDSQSELNLSGDFGMVRVGQFLSESYLATADYISMHNHDGGSSMDMLYDYIGRESNKIAYRTPEFAGFSAEVAHSFHERAEGEKNAWDLAANYEQGAVALGAGYSRNDKDWQAALRGLYSMEQLSIGAYYQRSKNQEQGTRNNYRLSAMYSLNQSELHANIGRANHWSHIDSSSATQWTLGYNYNLSSRTKLYTYYTKVHNGANINYYGGNEGENFSSFALGVRHSF